VRKDIKTQSIINIHFQIVVPAVGFVPGLLTGFKHASGIDMSE